jgi:hypothetical protein
MAENLIVRWTDPRMNEVIGVYAWWKRAVRKSGKYSDYGNSLNSCSTGLG